MRTITVFILLLALPIACGLADQSDLVNERPSATFLEREAHWKVDCQASWGSLLATDAFSNLDGQCQIGAQLQHSLQLCAFIYQPPGEIAHSNCPDFQGVLARLDRSCAQLGHWLESQRECAGD